MTTLNLQVSASLDDSREETDGTVAPTSTSVRINGSDKWGGFRFTNVTVSPGSTINTATFQYYIESTAEDDVNHVVYCEDADTSAAFSSSSYDITGRSRTTASVYEVQLGAGAGWRSAPDIADLVQEVIDRVGWASGNALTVLVKGNYNAAPYLYIESYDGASAQAAKLDIDYTAGGAGLSIPVAMHHLRQQGIA